MPVAPNRSAACVQSFWEGERCIDIQCCKWAWGPDQGPPLLYQLIAIVQSPHSSAVHSWTGPQWNLAHSTHAECMQLWLSLWCHMMWRQLVSCKGLSEGSSGDVQFGHINVDANVDAGVSTNAPAAAMTTWPLCIQHLFCFILIHKYNHHIGCSKYRHLWECMIGSTSH